MKGQSVILVALLLAGLVGVVALTVDGSRLYAEKAQMQTAADAGALAGARELCDKCNKCNIGQARVAAERFALLNGASDAKVSVRHDRVTVVAAVDVQPFFAGILGFRSFHIEADATAVCNRLVE
jgi:Flp pilus assembly protein TadG